MDFLVICSVCYLAWYFVFYRKKVKEKNNQEIPENNICEVRNNE